MTSFCMVIVLKVTQVLTRKKKWRHASELCVDWIDSFVWTVRYVKSGLKLHSNHWSFHYLYERFVWFFSPSWKAVITENTSLSWLTFLTSELFGSVVQVIILDTASLVSLEFTKSVGSICLAKDSIYFRIATLTWEMKRDLWSSGAGKDAFFS